MISEFNSFSLHEELVQAVAELGYTTPTPIQSAVIPEMLAGRDVIGQAQTGTGKTAAFSLPILQSLVPDQNQVQALVLAPTRELAMQVAKAIRGHGRYRKVRVMAVFGGQPYGAQVSRLRRGVDVVVGTPGRLLDLIRQEILDLASVRTVVLDEADEMLSMGFIEDIEAILAKTPASRQTTLFSATVPAGIRRLANQYMREPRSITIERQQLTVAAIEQRYYLVNQSDKLAALTRLFEVEEITRALIFARTRVGTAELANELTIRGFPAEALSGDLSQDARIRVLDRFRHNQIKVLVATDVAARGLDIDDISHVFNYDLPHDPEIYVHRVGRTGRAGKTGIAITLLTPKEQSRLRRIESLIRQKLTRAALPTVEEIHQYREEQLLEQVMVWLRRGRCRREREIVDVLVADGQDPVEVAAVALKMARAEEKQRPIAPLSQVRSERERRTGNGRVARENGPRGGNSSHERGMVRLVLSKGKVDGVRPNDVVSTIAHYANIPGRSIGKIRIQERQTWVDVPENMVAQVLANTGSYRIHREAVSIGRA